MRELAFEVPKVLCCQDVCLLRGQCHVPSRSPTARCRAQWGSRAGVLNAVCACCGVWASRR
jgi:hypothetical protein